MGALESASQSAQEGAHELQALRQQLKGAEASSKAQAAKLKEEQARVAAAEQQVTVFGGMSQASAL